MARPRIWRAGTDYVVGNQTQTDTVDIDAPIVFAGYGIEAPEYRWDDFKGVDVKGKVILVIVNEPPSKDPKFFAAETMTYYGRWTYKFEEAARKGAIGALIIHRTDLASYGWNVVQSSWSNEHGVPRRRQGSEARGRRLDSMGRGAADICRFRTQARRHGGARRNAQVQGAGTAGAVQGSHREPCAQVRFLQRGRHAPGHRSRPARPRP